MFFGRVQSVYGHQNNYKEKLSADSNYNNAIRLFDEGDFVKSIELFQISLEEYQKENKLKKIGDCYNYIAISFYYQGNYDQALDYFEKSRKTYLSIKDAVGVSSVLNNVGGIHFFLGRYLQAIDSYKQALQIQSKLKDSLAVGVTSQNIGAIYSKIKDYKSALRYYKQASLIFTKLEKEKEIAQNLNNRGFVYSQTGELNQAEQVLNKAYAIADKEKDIQLKLEVLSNIGTLLYIQKEYASALKIYKKSLVLSHGLNSQQYIGNSSVQIGKIFLKLDDTHQSVRHCSDGFYTAKKIAAISLQKDACDCLYEAYKVNGNAKLALEFFEKSNKLKDSLQSEETANRMMSMEFENKKLLDSISFVNKEHTLQLKHKEEVQQKEKQRNAIIVSLGMILLLSGGLYSRLNFVKKSKKAIQYEKDRSDKLLLNILPEEIAEELKEKGAVNARNFNLVAVLFSDFKSFTQTAEKMSPEELVQEINVCFKAFDHISEKFNVEKIKTIGDSYMAVGGIPVAEDDFLANTVFAALEMQQFMIKRKAENDLLGKPAFEMRIGIHAGPIVAGIVGVKKFQYDVWGDTVNTASRIECNGTVGKVNISEALYKLLKSRDSFSFQYRGKIHAKGKGDINMYYIDIKESSPTLKAIAQKAQAI